MSPTSENAVKAKFAEHHFYAPRARTGTEDERITLYRLMLYP